MLPVLGKAVPIGHRRMAVHLRQVVPAQLCRELVRSSESTGYHSALLNQRDGTKKLDTQFRHNLRVERNDASLASRILSYLGACVPPSVWAQSPSATIVPVEQHLWRLTRLNPLLRFSKYVDDENHQFAPHIDMSVKRDDNDVGMEQSFLTLQVYLNDDYAGGQTSFNFADRWHDVTPIRMGDILLFDHRIVHRANPVTLGTKYTLRTDVLYTSHTSCSNPPPSTLDNFPQTQ